MYIFTYAYQDTQMHAQWCSKCTSLNVSWHALVHMLHILPKNTVFNGRKRNLEAFSHQLSVEQAAPAGSTSGGTSANMKHIFFSQYMFSSIEGYTFI